MDRPRRALNDETAEERPESGFYVARRSGGFAQAEIADAPPEPTRGRRARTAEPPGSEPVPGGVDQVVDDEPRRRPRRAIPLPESPASPSSPAEHADGAPTPADAADEPPRPRRLEVPMRRRLDLPTLPRVSPASPRTPAPMVGSEAEVDTVENPVVSIIGGTPRVRRPGSRPRVHHDIAPLVIDRLIKSYRGAVAVRNLNFTVEPGRVTAFLGPNGAGKTTTLRILLGLVAPTAGAARFGDLSYAQLDDPQRRVGAVLDANFHPGRSGRNHLRVLAPTTGVDDSRVDAVLDLVDLTTDGRRPVGQYSQGMRQRLALAAALLGDPDYLILDEPANGLDPEGIRWLRSFLRDYADSGRLVFLSSHQLGEVQAIADDLVVINEGRLLSKLPLAQLRLGAGSVRARVSDLDLARSALSGTVGTVETGRDEQGPYLVVQSQEVTAIGSALFEAGVVVYELHPERRDLEQEFFAMLEQSS